MTTGWYTEEVMLLSDKELLELAARSVGMNDYHYAPDWNAMAKYLENDPKKGFVWSTYWNPIMDMKDSMHLASALGLVVNFSRPSAGFPYEPHAIWLDQFMDNMELAARSIVLAAARRQFMKEKKENGKEVK